MKKRLLIIFAVCVACLAFVGGIIIAIVVKNKDDESYVIPDEYVIEYPDVEEYFEENAKVIKVVPVTDSTDVYSEGDVTELLEKRGFTEYEITSAYSIDGVYDEPVEVSDSSETKHPMYETYYVSENDEVWTIMVIDGVIMAYPLSYNANYADKVPVVVSESDEIMSYDSSTNSFYKTIPNDDVMNVRVVDKIDAETLDSLTMEELANG